MFYFFSLSEAKNLLLTTGSQVSSLTSSYWRFLLTRIPWGPVTWKSTPWSRILVCFFLILYYGYFYFSSLGVKSFFSTAFKTIKDLFCSPVSSIKQINHDCSLVVREHYSPPEPRTQEATAPFYYLLMFLANIYILYKCIFSNGDFFTWICFFLQSLLVCVLIIASVCFSNLVPILEYVEIFLKKIGIEDPFKSLRAEFILSILSLILMFSVLVRLLITLSIYAFFFLKEIVYFLARKFIKKNED